MFTVKRSLSLFLLAAALPLAAFADLPGKHPGYLHALTDMRAARWNLEHRPGDAAVSGQEDIALTEVDRAINEAKTAAVEDGKNLEYKPREDAHLDHPGRLHHALELLKKARHDISGEEDNPEARELRHRVMEHLDASIRATETAIHDVEHGR